MILLINLNQRISHCSDIISKLKTKNPALYPALREDAVEILLIQMMWYSWMALLWSDKQLKLNRNFDYPINQAEGGSQ